MIDSGCILGRSERPDGQGPVVLSKGRFHTRPRLSETVTIDQEIRMKAQPRESSPSRGSAAANRSTCIELQLCGSPKRTVGDGTSRHFRSRSEEGIFLSSNVRGPWKGNARDRRRPDRGRDQEPRTRHPDPGGGLLRSCAIAAPRVEHTKMESVMGCNGC